ncbi:MAG: YybH family protein [Ktedonobacterales bacterium]
MTDERTSAEQPDDLARFFIERANAGDAEGLAALYTPDAILAFPSGQEPVVGRQAILAVYERLLAPRPQFQPGQQLPTLRNGDLALTATRLASGDVTAEVAQRQPDGAWLWIIDRPSFRG